MFKASLASLVLLSLTATAGAATASAKSGSIWTGPANTTLGSAAWHFWNPRPADSITWTSGTNYADGAAFTHASTSEAYFTFGGGAIAGRTFTGFAYNDGPGPAGSHAITSGSGSSTYVGGIFTTATASWSLTATGALGSSAPPAPSYSSTCSGNDPKGLTAADLGGYTGQYSLFYSASLGPASWSSMGGVHFRVYYSTATQNIELLDVLLSDTTLGSGVAVGGSSVAGLTIYSVSSVEESPTSLLASPVTLAQIQTGLEADIVGNALLGVHHYAFLLDGLALPTVTLNDGTVAKMHADLTVSDAAAIPEPTGGLALAATALTLTRRRNIC